MSDDIKFRNIVITQKEREFTKTIKDEIFTVRIPLPFEKAQIIATTARGLGGLDIDCFRPEDQEYVRMVVTLNNVLVKTPEWWQGADKCPDDELLFQLWEHYLVSEKNFSEILKKNNGIKTVEKPKGDNRPVDNG